MPLIMLVFSLNSSILERIFSMLDFFKKALLAVLTTLPLTAGVTDSFKTETQSTVIIHGDVHITK